MTADTLIRGLREQIVERLRGEILSGRLSEGTPLPRWSCPSGSASAGARSVRLCSN